MKRAWIEARDPPPSRFLGTLAELQLQRQGMLAELLRSLADLDTA